MSNEISAALQPLIQAARSAKKDASDSAKSLRARDWSGMTVDQKLDFLRTELAENVYPLNESTARLQEKTVLEMNEIDGAVFELTEQNQEESHVNDALAEQIGNAFTAGQALAEEVKRLLPPTFADELIRKRISDLIKLQEQAFVIASEAVAIAMIEEDDEEGEEGDDDEVTEELSDAALVELADDAGDVEEGKNG